MHNLSTVFRFEVIRNLKKKSFWLVSLLLPLMVGVVIGIAYFSNKATNQAAQDTSKQKFSFEVVDKSGLVKKEVISAFGGKVSDSQDEAVAAVKAGNLDAVFVYPRELSSGKVMVYGQDVGLFDNSRYTNVATALLQTSVATDVTPDIATVLSGQVATEATTYKDGEVYNGIKEMIVPGVFLILFYVMIVTFGNQMLNSTVEEKENRVIEMILTTITARTLIIGKIFALIVLGFLQVFVVITPIIIAYLLFRSQLQLPDFDLSQLSFDPVRIMIGFVLFTLSFILFTGLLVAIGAASPTAKDAGGFLGVVMVLIFGPLYAASLFVSSPGMPIVQFLSYFPFTAPIPLLLRNAVGNLALHEALIAAVILAATAVVVLMLAIRIFRYGALEYNRKLHIKEILTRRA